MTSTGPTTLGVDLGGTQLRAALVDAEGHVQDSLKAPTDRHGPDAVMGQMVGMLDRLKRPSTLAIGVGIPGSVDREDGVVVNIPALPGWTSVPLAERVATATGLPVFLDNDAKAAALGEWIAGAGRGCDHFVYVTISTGIGSAAVVDGRLLRGAGGLAGESGHTRVTDSGPRCACGLIGCWQAVASGAALDRRGQEIADADPSSEIARRAAGAPVTGQHVGAAARAGDPAALAILADHAVLLGIGFANIQHVYAPERIVVGGGVSALLEPMRADIERTLRARLLPGFRPAEIVRAALLDDAGLIGAAFRAREELVDPVRSTRAPT